MLIISESRGALSSAQFMMSTLSALGMPAPYGLPLFFAETSRIDLHFLLSAVRDMPEPPRLILIDGYEGIRVDDAPSSPLGSLPSLLKLLAQCLTTDILVLHDLPGFSEERSDFRPHLEDLAGSDPLRDVADLVLTVYWPALYDPDQDEDESPERDDVFVSLLRNRHGTLHSRKLRHRPTHLKRAPWVIFEEVETAG